MVPLFYHADSSISKQILKACYDGGARLMEFTNRGDFALEVFTDLIKYAKKNSIPNKKIDPITPCSAKNSK